MKVKVVYEYDVYEDDINDWAKADAEEDYEQMDRRELLERIQEACDYDNVYFLDDEQGEELHETYVSAYDESADKKAALRNYVEKINSLLDDAAEEGFAVDEILEQLKY